VARELPAKYNAQEVEPEIYRFWLEGNYFHADPDGERTQYCIVIPPPNVTAALHMGHALNNTLQDVLIRYHRMLGDNAVWIGGTDHAGIATQTVVEKRVLTEEGKRRTEFARDEFVAKIQAWKNEYEAQILGQLKAMGCSCDWARTRFTMDPICARAVREAFFRLFADGLIYRGKRLVNWDVATQTALADDEVETQEIDGHFWYLRYPMYEPVEAGGERIEYVTVATTRPETMLGDTAVAINPADPRARYLVGKQVRLPIADRIIPIIADEHVVLPDPDSDDMMARYATGFLKVTPAHDPNDWEIGQRHGLPVINVMAPDGTISDQFGWDDVGGADFLLGLDRYEAREAIVEWFRKNELLEDVKPYRHSVGHSYRSHVPIEPYLSDQWYVRVTDERLAGAALRAMADEQYEAPPEAERQPALRGEAWEGRLRFHPDRYAKTFQTWHENIRDWCISRQLWWGHRIPVWSQDLELPTDVQPDPVEGHDLDAQVLAAINNAIGGDWHESVRGGGHYVLTVERHPEKEGWIRTYVCIKDQDSPLQVKLEAAGWVQDEDVLDTWFSSALWPFSTLGWPENTPELQAWNPGNVLCTARDIITLWVSRMVMTNLYFLNRLPFTDVYIHAMIQDGEGRRMSKSLGNGVDPLDIIEQYGADAMRYSLAYLSTGMQDIRMPVRREKLPDGRTINTSERFDIGRNLCTKLWNAARLVFMELDEEFEPQPLEFTQLPREDRWILSRLTTCIEQATSALDGYLFADAAASLYRFFWNEFCDWYLEWIKPRLREDDPTRPQAQQLATFCLDQILRLAHPFIPYITEKLWGELNRVCPRRGFDEIFTADNALVVSSWPGANADWSDHAADRQMELLQQMIRVVRDIRANVNRSRAANKQKSVARLPRVNVRCSEQIAGLLDECAGVICRLANVEELLVNPTGFTLGGSAAAVITDYNAQPVELAVPIGELIDIDQERKRLRGELDQLDKLIQRSQTRLGDPNFTQKAPAHIVEEHRQRLEELQSKYSALEKSLKELHG